MRVAVLLSLRSIIADAERLGLASADPPAQTGMRQDVADFVASLGGTADRLARHSTIDAILKAFP